MKKLTIIALTLVQSALFAGEGESKEPNKTETPSNGHGGTTGGYTRPSPTTIVGITRMSARGAHTTNSISRVSAVRPTT